jgi:hypothetical protein
MFFTTGGTIETAVLGMSNWTGSVFLSILMIVIVMMVLGLAFPLPLEWTAIFIMPLLLGLMAYDSMFYQSGGVFLLYLSFILGQNLLRR